LPVKMFGHAHLQILDRNVRAVGGNCRGPTGARVGEPRGNRTNDGVDSGTLSPRAGSEASPQTAEQDPGAVERVVKVATRRLLRESGEPSDGGRCAAV
jgi:hypothetical protein